MPWMPGMPSDPGQCPQGSLRPVGVVAHRTYGSWNGDYAVGLGSRCPVGFHFLVGPDPGQVVQFYSTDTRCAHAGTNANGNDLSVGIEVSGTNDDRMTDWQVEQCRRIVDWLQQVHGIEPVYRFSTAHDLRADFGYVPHSAVAGADHSDYWTVDDWNRIVPPEPPDLLQEDSMGVITIRDGEPGEGSCMLVAAGRLFPIDDWDERASLGDAFGQGYVTRDLWDQLWASIPEG